jgi:hypothetical protein
MGARLSQAERFRRHNQEMKLALAENIPLAEASWRLFKERLGAAERARAERLEQIARENSERRRERLCGTVDQGTRPQFWWERD